MCFISQEIFSHKTPFQSARVEAILTSVIIHNRRPSRPPKLDDRIWALVQRCWEKDPTSRPMIGEIVEELEKFEVRPVGSGLHLHS